MHKGRSTYDVCDLVPACQIIAHLAPSQVTRLRDLQKQLRATTATVVPTAPTSAGGGSSLPGAGYGLGTDVGASAATDASAASALQAELDELVGAECLYCGQVMIDSVAVPFVDEDSPGGHEWDI